MKIKHWQGYGSVNYTTLKNTQRELVIDVYGEHEWGVLNKYSVKEWLFDRVKKQYKNIEKWNMIITNYLYVENGVEHCTYTFTPKFGLTFEELSARTY